MDAARVKPDIHVVDRRSWATAPGVPTAPR
jgi:hypothetical protein